MDITPIFKASVMAVKLQNNSFPVPNKNRILQTKVRDEFAKQAKDVSNKITTLKNVLLENRAAYMKFAAHLKRSAQMTDEQRDLIDKAAEKFVIFYTQHIAQMRSDWKNVKTKPQRYEHIQGVIEILSNYLRAVQNLHLEQKKYRIQHELETYRLLKLASDKRKIPIRHGKDFKVATRNNDSENENQSDNDEDTTTSNSLNSNDNKQTSSQKVALEDDFKNSEQINDDTVKVLSPEDIQMFESENVQLLHELQGLSEEVDQIEKNVVDIARLQEIFTEKVIVQKNDIERIANAVVGSTENVKDANEQIKEAIQRNAGLRVWALFFLLVMSFTLLFLNWYND